MEKFLKLLIEKTVQGKIDWEGIPRIVFPELVVSYVAKVGKARYTLQTNQYATRFTFLVLEGKEKICILSTMVEYRRLLSDLYIVVCDFMGTIQGDRDPGFTDLAESFCKRLEESTK